MRRGQSGENNGKHEIKTNGSNNKEWEILLTDQVAKEIKTDCICIFDLTV